MSEGKVKAALRYVSVLTQSVRFNVYVICFIGCWSAKKQRGHMKGVTPAKVDRGHVRMRSSFAPHADRIVKCHRHEVFHHYLATSENHEYSQ